MLKTYNKGGVTYAVLPKKENGRKEMVFPTDEEATEYVRDLEREINKKKKEDSDE